VLVLEGACKRAASLQPAARDEILYRGPITSRPIAYANGSRGPNGTGVAADVDNIEPY
jgi:hypothetical protein